MDQIKLWSLSTEIEEKTDKLHDVKSRLNEVFAHQAEPRATTTLSTEYWHQVENKEE